MSATLRLMKMRSLVDASEHYISSMGVPRQAAGGVAVSRSMSRRRSPAQGTRAHLFGGDWTGRKLEVVAKYLRAYTTALSRQPFEKIYIDAFAGTGYRTLRTHSTEGVETPLFPDFGDDDAQQLLDGSAAIALRTEPAFDRYVFIEQRRDRCEQLEHLKVDFPDRAARIEIRQAEANRALEELCEGDWRGRRAVVFLDPYGMQVEWTTMERIADTKAIDLWLLVPIGIGVSRLLKRSGEIPTEWRTRLDRFLGTPAWFDEFYHVEIQPTLFGLAEEELVRDPVSVIGRWFNERLRLIFPGVAERPAVLTNKRNCPMYLLCFAASNPSGAPLALKIANHLLKGV